MTLSQSTLGERYRVKIITCINLMLHQSCRLIVGILYQEEVYGLLITMHYRLLVIILYIVLVFKLVHEPFYQPKIPPIMAKNEEG